MFGTTQGNSQHLASQLSCVTEILLSCECEIQMELDINVNILTVTLENVDTFMMLKLRETGINDRLLMCQVSSG